MLPRNRITDLFYVKRFPLSQYISTEAGFTKVHLYISPLDSNPYMSYTMGISLHTVGKLSVILATMGLLNILGIMLAELAIRLIMGTHTQYIQHHQLGKKESIGARVRENKGYPALFLYVVRRGS